MKISVITPTYNRKFFLLEMVESVQRSIFEPLQDVSFEIVIYDDASTDDTKAIFNKNLAGNITYIRSDENQGQSIARNKAIEKASGEYIFLLDSDDLVPQRALYNFVRAVQAHPEKKWFFADFYEIDTEKKYQIGEDYYTIDYPTIRDWLVVLLKDTDYIPSSIFFKKEIFFEVGGYDEKRKVAEDIDLYIRFLLKGYMPQYCNFISHLRRVHSSNVSIEMVGHHIQYREEMKKKYKKQLATMDIF